MAEQKPQSIGEFEEYVLIAVERLGEERAYGVTIRQTVQAATGREIAIGAIYTTLDRLEQKGLVSSYEGEATPQRGGRKKRHFRLEGAGAQALNEAEAIRARLRQSLIPALQRMV